MKRALSILLLCAACSACSKKPQAPRRTEPWLASASASASSAPLASAPLVFRFTAESSIRFSLPGRKAKPAGQLPLSGGQLHLDVRDLKSASANIEADLTRLSLDESSLPSSLMVAGSPSTIAQQWLELGPSVSRDKRQQYGLARFELSSVEGLSAPALDVATARAVRAVAVGTLLVHGYRAPVRAEVTIERLTAPAGAPLRLSIRSAAPLVLPLATHDIVARGPSGTADPLESARAEGSVGKSAQILFELVAEAQPGAHK